MTSQNPISDDVRRFVLTSVPSVPYLEALLLLRSERGPWDAATIARRLYVPEAKAAELLRALQESGIAVRPDGAAGWHYEPSDPNLRAMIDKVEHIYTTRLVEVTALIHSRDKRAMQFADAFRWKKD